MAKKPTQEPEEEIIYVSKSELKRDAQQYHQLGVDIAQLGKKQREKLPLSAELVAAMELADKLRGKHDAYRRHLNFIAKQLRTTSNVEDLQQGLDLLLNRNNQADVLLNQVEQLRDELIAKGDEKINTLLEAHPTLERQKLRQLVRQAKKEHQAEKPGKGSKELFQLLKELILP
ncbi:ribosome biogenesis factor YjgA [Pseudoalteromonas ardens]|uniref:Dual-action ribosomal maturation protein DarP n=1 Tax=Pseudoalteromonas rubra TaxID=43658 RepID=A0A0L0EXN3_9GAMM|nr:ribosome biogenesis factor YjgA [Pseudoalteromonas sp. R96]KNC69232.1 ABC transporter ATP-binding protein [Pseudoalteromonas rubra]MDK1311819.1 ribosome biogenesis factor YjgA [Pseudoalteromonas sp. R96]